MVRNMKIECTDSISCVFPVSYLEPPQLLCSLTTKKSTVLVDSKIHAPIQRPNADGGCLESGHPFYKLRLRVLATRNGQMLPNFSVALHLCGI